MLPACTARVSASSCRAASRSRVGGSAGVAFHAFERLAKRALAAFGSRDPRPVDPRRVVPHVLIVAAGELGDPVPLVVPVIADDLSLHDGGVRRSCGEGERCRPAAHSRRIPARLPAPEHGRNPHGPEGRLRYAPGMDASILWYTAAGLLIVVGLAGAILPALPGVPLVFAGMWLAAWVADYSEIGVWTVALLGVLAGLAMLLDFVAGWLGARRVAASTAALWGAAIGTIVGLFFGLPGLLLGPFIGALAGELRSGGTLGRSTRVGIATWIGLLFGTLAKVALSFTMLGIFVGALLIS